jgi:hypothetical protein
MTDESAKFVGIKYRKRTKGNTANHSLVLMYKLPSGNTKYKSFPCSASGKDDIRVMKEIEEFRKTNECAHWLGTTKSKWEYNIIVSSMQVRILKDSLMNYHLV